MDIEAIISSAGQEMLDISRANTEQAFEAEEQAAEGEPLPQPVDMWQNRRGAIANRSTPVVRGARPKMQLDLGLLVDGGIGDAYKKAVDDSESLLAEGERQRAQLVIQQYMQDWFYPTVDALIRLNSQEELLASQDALEALDALALVPGGGRTDGYTSVYVSNLYAPAGNTYHSDAQVRQAVGRIETLCAAGDIRAAVAVANRIRDKIERGDNVATPDDYELIQKVVLRS